jgi:hypothetical protein
MTNFARQLPHRAQRSGVRARNRNRRAWNLIDGCESKRRDPQVPQMNADGVVTGKPSEIFDLRPSASSADNSLRPDWPLFLLQTPIATPKIDYEYDYEHEHERTNWQAKRR